MRWPNRARAFALALAILGVTALAGRGGHADPNLDCLRRLSPCELHDLFTRADVGRPLTGRARGRLLCLTDRVLPRVKVRLANSVWAGKAACDDGWFVNRWAGGRVEWIDSCYVIGPSWVDGRPAVIMEYAPKTPLFANMHDELREIAPGIYIGPVFERCPCPKLRGYIGLQLECGN